MAAIMNTAGGLTDGLVSKGHAVIDALFPPEKRSQWMEKLKSFAVSNPKLTAFLLTNIALSGGPLLLFVVFTITVFVFSLVAAILIGLVAALLFTVFMLLVALFVVLPTIFMTTMAATFLFLWALGGYYIIQWFNRIEGPGAEGEAIGDKVNALTGGRLTWLMSAARDAPKLGREKEADAEKEPLLSDSENGMSAKKFSNAGGASNVKSTAKSAAPVSTPVG